MTVPTASALLEGMTRFGWKPVLEHGSVIALSNDSRCSITLEPGGQFGIERRAGPCTRPAARCTSTRQVREVCDELDLGMIGLGFDPISRRDEVPWMPKGRYRIMRDYMPKRASSVST
jgi:glutamate--cysteine ligase